MTLRAHHQLEIAAGITLPHHLHGNNSSMVETQTSIQGSPLSMLSCTNASLICR
jgi:hypothetical protein